MLQQLVKSYHYASWKCPCDNNHITNCILCTSAVAVLSIRRAIFTVGYKKEVFLFLTYDLAVFGEFSRFSVDYTDFFLKIYRKSGS